MRSDQVRAFYAALGVELPGWSTREAAARCFARPDDHNRADRSPSCSVNLASGAWNCHGCGARGGAYDAALAAGHTPRSAMDLLIMYGLAEPRSSGGQLRSGHGAPRLAQSASRVSAKLTRPEFRWDEADVTHCSETLDSNSRLVRRLILERGWAPSMMRKLDLGFDGARVTIPVRNAHGRLRGVLRYDPFGRREPKMRAVPGTRLGLVPHPMCDVAEHIVLVEGPPDMIAARSCGLAAIAIPGTNAWQPRWARLLRGKRVTIVMDCDPAGRRAANEIAASLEHVAEEVAVIDIWPDRDDGYDLSDHPPAPAVAASPFGALHDRVTFTSAYVPLPQAPAGLCPPRAGGIVMTDIPVANGDYTQDARTAILAAVRNQHDFGGWLAGALSCVAADLGSTSALTAGRRGSWEADLVQQLVKGTVGWDDDYLADYLSAR